VNVILVLTEYLHGHRERVS